MDKPLCGSVFSVTILLYAADVLGKPPNEQVEEKEREFERIKNMMTGMLVMLPLEDNWEMRVAE